MEKNSKFVYKSAICCEFSSTKQSGCYEMETICSIKIMWHIYTRFHVKRAARFLLIKKNSNRLRRKQKILFAY